MGQYYYPVLMTGTGGRLIGSFYAHSFDDNGLKLTEHSYIGNQFVESVIAKAMFSGYPTTIVWIGDYACLEDDVLPLTAHAFSNPKDNVAGIRRDYPRIFLRAQRAMDNEVRRIPSDDPEIVEFLPKAKKIVMYDLLRREKINLREYEEHAIAERVKNGTKQNWFDDPREFILHPLPILTCSGNGKGGGDYSGTDMEMVGAWAMHPILIQEEGQPDPVGKWKDISTELWFEEVL